MDKLVIEAEKLNLEIIKELKILVEIDLLLREKELDKIGKYFSNRSLIDSSEKIEIINITKFLREFEREKIESLISGRDKLHSYYRSLLAYETEMQYLNSYIEELVFFQKSKNLALEISYDSLDFEKDKFLNRLDNKLINYSKESQEYDYISKKLVKALPFRLSKYKYYDNIKASLIDELNSKRREYAIERINNYKYSAIGIFEKNYSILFDYYFRQVEKVRKDLKSKKADIDELSRELSNLLKAINMDLSYIFYLGRYLNNAILYRQLEELLKTDRTIREKENLEDLFSISQDRLLDSQKAIINFFNLEKLDENKVLELDRVFSQSTYFMELYNRDEFLKFPIYSKVDLTLIDENLLNIEIDNFISYLDRNFKNLNRYEARIRMKMLLLKLNKVFLSKNEILDYVSYSLDGRLVDKNELYMTFEILNKIL